MVKKLPEDLYIKEIHVAGIIGSDVKKMILDLRTWYIENWSKVDKVILSANNLKITIEKQEGS